MEISSFLEMIREEFHPEESTIETHTTTISGPPPQTIEGKPIIPFNPGEIIEIGKGETLEVKTESKILVCEKPVEIQTTYDNYYTVKKMWAKPVAFPRILEQQNYILKIEFSEYFGPGGEELESQGVVYLSREEIKYLHFFDSPKEE